MFVKLYKHFLIESKFLQVLRHIVPQASETSSTHPEKTIITYTLFYVEKEKNYDPVKI